MTRRDFAKLSVIAILCLTLTGCPKALNVAIEVLNSAAGILAPLNIKDSNALKEAAKGLSDVEKAYQDYEKAEEALKPGKLATLSAAITATQDNLSVILADVHVKNPALIGTITTAVAIANTVLVTIIDKLPSSAKPLSARANAQPLPTIKAKSANDLKKAWNDAVKAEHPEAMVK